MEGVSHIFGTILGKNDFLEIYLDELDEHPSLESKAADGVVQHISSALSKPRMYNEALVVLISYLKQCSVNVLEQKAALWTTLTLKAINSKGTDGDYELAYSALSLLASNSVRSSEVSKSFSSNHLSKVYESLSKVPPMGYLAALKCVEICLRLYPGPSGPFRNSVDKFVSKFLDTLDDNLSLWSGRCINLLQQVRGGGIQGISHKSSWSIYQEKLLVSLHSVLDLAFSNCNEFYEEDKALKEIGFPAIEVNNEPTKRAAQLYIRIRNLVNYFISALRDPFPVAKPIKPKKILTLISRGLNVTCHILEKNPISDNLAFCVLLPKIHFILLDLLQTLILTLKTNLKPHHLTVLDLLVDTLNWTYSRQTAGIKKPLSKLRSKVYEVLSLWCITMQNGSRIELVGEAITEQVLFDVFPFQNECTLKVLSGSKKHMSKKARRQLHKAQNEQSHISQSHAHDNSFKRENFSEEGNQRVCVSALKCLQQMLIAAANFLKPTLIKMVQNKVAQICGVFYELPMEPRQLYFNWECRMEIYKVLLIFITQTHHLCPPPTQIVLHILKTAQVCDRNPTVRKQCAESLMYIESIIHPRKEGLLFPADLRDIRNNFTIVGKENLLVEGIFDATIQSGIDASNSEAKSSHIDLPNAQDEHESVDTSVGTDSSTDAIEIDKSSCSSDVSGESAVEVESCVSPTISVDENIEISKQTNAEKNDVSLLPEPVFKKQRLDLHEEESVVDSLNAASIESKVNATDETNAEENYDSLLREPVCKKHRLDLQGGKSIVDSIIAESVVVDTTDGSNKKIIENDNSSITLLDGTDGCEENKANLEINCMASSRTDDDILAEIEAAFVDELN